MYHQYFGLNEPAFTIAVNPKYLYMSNQHKEAIAHLLYGIKGGGFVLLSGEVGTGKTTIIRQVLNQLPEATDVAFILNPMAEIESLLQTICEELNVEQTTSNGSIKALMDVIQTHLLKNHAAGKRTVLIIDEAQLLSAEVLEQIRLLTNLETETEKLLQIILVGQPEINTVLSQPRLRQLAQRITARFHLTPLDLRETEKYIQHRLHVAGLKERKTLFPKSIVKRIHRFSDGVPRLINIICERALVGAYGHNSEKVTKHIFQLALDEIRGVKLEAKKSSIAPVLIASAFTAIALISTGWFFLKQRPALLASTVSNNQPVANSPAQNSGLENRTLQNAPVRNPTAENNIAPPAESKATNINDSSANNSSINYSNKIPDSTIKFETEYKTRVTQPAYFDSKTKAFRSLFSYYNVSIENEGNPCWQFEQHRLECSRENYASWDEFSLLNRPAILTLITDDKRLAYGMLVGLNDSEVFLINESDQILRYKKEEIGKLWNGGTVYIWRKPPEYNNPVAPGMRSPTVAWAAEQFAIIDGQEKPITDESYSLLLKTRVEIFQANHGLENDGYIGKQTIMKLNELRGLSPALLRSITSRDEG